MIKQANLVKWLKKIHWKEAFLYIYIYKKKQSKEGKAASVSLG